MTRGVPAEVWIRWYADNRNGPIVLNGLVMGWPDEGDVLPLALQSFCFAHRDVQGSRKVPQG